MRSKTILDGFPLRINISLLVISIAFVVLSSLSDKETLRIALLITGWVLTLAAVAPSSFGFVREQMKKGKSRQVEDPDTVVAGWKPLCRSIGIKNDIKIKVFGNLRNAYAKSTTIAIGQPVLDSLDSVSIKAVFAHELAHIKRHHALKPRHWLWFALVIALLVGVMRATVPLVFTCSIYQLNFSWSTFSVLSIIIIDILGITIRFISWPDEYEADLVADQCVKQGAVVSFLTAMAALRQMDVTRDFYTHPSMNKRKANLGWTRKTRLRKWYLDF